MATISAPVAIARKSLTFHVCSSLCRLFYQTPLRRYGLRARAMNDRYESWNNYLADRVSQVDSYRKEFQSHADFKNRTVMELGCASGYMLAAFLDHDQFRAIGAELDPARVARGQKIHAGRIELVQSSDAAVPLSDSSVDIIYCVDTVEHLMQPRKMMLDCYRILRPGGRFLIHWHPWLGPYGSHLEDIIPLPWAHALFSMHTLLDVAAELYESPLYNPACFWVDPATGQRRPNPYRDHERWEKFLNKMTVRGLKRLLNDLPFRVLHFRKTGFGGKSYPLARFFSGLAHVPLLDEFFLKSVFCVLEKPAEAKP
ncbi:MAG: class I SAM-dependent methyltransferase [Acidobacteria bacterium]|nr:class I SAM-dependent methyltransferase [Acidobacteriota bacterium]